MPVQIGAHTLDVDGDLVLVHFDGDVSESEIIEILRHTDSVQGAYGYHLGLSDVRRLGKISPAVRRYVMEWGKKEVLMANACFGASLMSRTLVTLSIRAISLIRHLDAELAFFKREGEARDWLNAQRHRMRMRRPPPGDAARNG